MNTSSFAISNVRVFTGTELTGPGTVIVDGGVVGRVAGQTQVTGSDIDGRGGVLLPGLIDAHVHLAGPSSLSAFARYGVTTVLDMGTWPAAAVDALRGGHGRTDVRSSGIGATVAGTSHSRIPGRPAGGLVAGADDAGRWVSDRVAEGADYIKVIADVPGPDQATLDAIVVQAHRRGRKVVAHASITPAVRMAQRAGVDVLTHVPLDAPLDAAAVDDARAAGLVVVPTLTMMKGIADRTGRPAAYAHAGDSLAALYRAGVPVIAGTHANQAPGVPFSPPFGSSLHDELALLVQAGLAPLDAIRAATVLPARHFDLPDRGVIAPGRRADLILLSGNPLADIGASRTVQRVWIGGTEIPPIPQQ